MTEEEKKTSFVDFVKVLKDTYDLKIKQEGLEDDEDTTFDYIIGIYSDNIHKELIENMTKIYNHFGGEFDNFIKGVKINKDTYDLNVVFGRKPESDEMARCVACIKNLEFTFKVNYKAIWLEEDSEGDKVFRMYEIKVQEQ